MDSVKSSVAEVGAAAASVPRPPVTMIIPPVKRETQGPRTNQLIYCRDVIMKTLMRHKASAAFKQPVDPIKLGIPNYYYFCPEPMDLSTIQQRLSNRYYQSGDECVDDFQLMFVNCYTYNPPKSEVVLAANELELTLIRKLIDMPEVEEVVPVGQRITSRRSSTASTGTVADEEEGEEGKELKMNLRKKEVKPVEEETVEQPKGPIGGKVMRIPVKGMKKMVDESDSESSEGDSDGESSSGSSSSSEEEEQEGVDGEMEIFRVNHERRQRRMVYIQQQITELQTQMRMLQEEEAEDDMLRFRQSQQNRARARSVPASGPSEKGKKRAYPRRSNSSSPARKTPKKSQGQGTSTTSKKKSASASKPSSGAGTSAIAAATLRAISSSVGNKSGKSSASKGKTVPSKKEDVPASKKTTPAPAPGHDVTPTSTSSSSTKTKKPPGKDGTQPMTPAQVKELLNKLSSLDEEFVEEVMGITRYYDVSEDNADDDDIAAIIKGVPAACQWDMWDMVEKKLEANKAIAPASSPVSAVAEKPAEESMTFHAVVSPTPLSSVPEPTTTTEALISLQTPPATPSASIFAPVYSGGIVAAPVDALALSNEYADTLQVVPPNIIPPPAANPEEDDDDDDDDEEDDPTLDMY